MHKIIRLSLLIVILSSLLGFIPISDVQAQISLPAEINKSFTPISITSGGISRLRVSIFNPNAFQLNNATWTDNLPAGITIANPVNLTNTCGGSVSASPGGTSFSLSGGTVPAQTGANPGACFVEINVTSTTLGNLINTIPAGALTATDGGGVIITNTTPASATLRVNPAGTPTVSKSFNPNTVWVGQTSRLSIVITNTDSSLTLTQASLTDNLPTNVFLASPPAPTLTGCGASASVSAVGGGTSVTLNNGTILPNSTCTIQVSVVSNIRGSYNNTIPANALQTQQGRTNASPASARLRVQDIGVTKAFSPATFPAGGTSLLTITLRNPTGTPYTGVSVSDTLPGTVLTFIPGSASTTCGGLISLTPAGSPRTITLTGGTIPAGTPTNPGFCVITVQVTAPPGSSTATETNTILANAISTDQGATNIVPANGSVTVAGSQVTGIKSFSPSTIVPGGNSRLRIDIFAPGDTNLTNFTVTDPLPAGVTVSNVDAAGNPTPATMGGCGAGAVLTANTGATSISLTNGTILAGTRCRINVFVTSSTAGVHTNTIPPSNITNNENRVPASSLTANLTVSGSTNLGIGIVKAFNPVSVFGGSASTMSIQIVNLGNVTLTGITFTDDMTLLGTGMIIANPPNLNTGNCGGALTGVSGATSFTFSGGILPVGGTCTLTLGVTMNVNGNRTNRIPVGAVTTTQGATNPDPTEASLTNLPGARVSKAFAPNAIAAGGSSVLTITIENTTNIPLSGLGLIDDLASGGPLPAGLMVAGSATTNCNGTVTAVAGTQRIELTGGSLAANASCTIEVSVTGNTPGNYNNCIEPMDFSNDQNAQMSRACATLVVTGGTGGITKTLIGTSATHTTGSEVTIGEIVTYQVTVPISPGTYTNARVVDTLDPGLAFVACNSIDGATLTATAGSFSSICQNPTVDDAGGGTSEDVDRRVTFDFGTLTNNGAQDVPLTLIYDAIVLDIASNVDGVSRNNSALFLSDQSNRGPGQATVTIREPKLVVDKTADNTFIANGTEATITLTVSHAPNSSLDAFDMILVDPLPTGLDYVANSLDCAAGAQDPTTCVVDTSNPAQPTIRAAWDVFTLAGGTSLIRFRVMGNASLPVSGNVTNVANLSWTSLPDDNPPPNSFSNPPNQFAIERFFDPGDSVNIYGDDDAFVFNPVGGGPGGGGAGDDEDRERDRPATLGAFLIPVTGFAPDAMTKIETARPVYDTTGLSLEIPALKVNLPIVGVQLQKGTWDVNWLWNQAGWLQKTAYPTFPGNSVITAHVVNADGKPGPFARIKQLRVGDYIYIDLGGYRYTYEVVTNARVKPDDIRVLRHEEDPYLTLITCDRYDMKTGKYLVRIAVRAKLIDIALK